jgi:hypothetical protein
VVEETFLVTFKPRKGNKMIALLNQLRLTLTASVNEYRIIRRRIFKVLLYSFMVSLLAVALNFWGLKTVDAIIGCILPLIVLYAFTAPATLGAVLTAGVISSPRHPIQQVEKVAELVAKAVGWILLVFSFFFLVMGTIPLGRNFWSIAIVYLGLGLLLLINVQGIQKTKFAAPLLYGYVIVSLILAIGSMVPGEVHIKAYGYDFFRWFRSSPVERAIARVESAETQAKERMLATDLALIEKNIKEGRRLTTNEQSIMAYARAMRDNNTTPAAIKKAWREVLPAKTPPPPRSLSWMRWEVKSSTNTVFRAYDGDKFVYVSPAPLVVVMNRTNYYANASSSPGEERFFRFYGLPPEGREIQIQPLGTNSFWLEYRIESRTR